MTLSFLKSPCVWTLWCDVWRLWVFKVPLCVGSVLWGVRILSFQSSPFCGLCALARENFELSKFPYVWALCCNVWGLWVFQSSPVYETLSLCWRDWVFTKKSLYWGFSPVLERLVFSGQNPRWWRSKAVKKNVEINILTFQKMLEFPIFCISVFEYF